MSRISKWVITAGMLVLCLSFAAAQESNKRAGDSADQATLDKLDVVHGRQDISIEITASTAVTPKVTTLKEPDRVVLDFPNTIPGTETRRIAVDREGVKSVRMGVNSDVPPTTRVVIDLDAARDYQLVPENNRFIVKFRNVPGGMTTAATVDKKPTPAVIPVAAKPADAPLAKPASKPAETAVAEPKQVASLTPTIPAPAPNSTSSMPAPKPKSDPAPVQAASTAGPQTKPSAAVMTASASNPAPTSIPATSTPAPQTSSSTTPAPAPAQPSNSPAPQATTMASAQPAAADPPPANIPDASHEDKGKAAPEMKRADYDPKTYIIGEQDVLGIDVWKEKDISQTVVVRPDGKITIPLVDEVYVVGLTPLQLQTLLEDKLKPFLTVPQVTVIVKEISSRKVYLMGQVGRTGPFLINSTTTVLQLIAQAGGLRDFAKKKKIYIMRNENGKTEQFRFNYDDVIKGKRLEQNIILRPGDTVVVP